MNRADRHRHRRRRAGGPLARDRARSGGDQARDPRHGLLSPAPRRAPRRAVRAVEAAHDGHRRRGHGRGHLRDPGRLAHHPRGRPAEALLAGRAAQPVQRAHRRPGHRRAAPHRAGAGRRLHRAPAPPAGGAARDHRLGPGERAHLAALARADRARRLVRGPPLDAARPQDPGPHRADAGRAATGSTARTPARAGGPPRSRHPARRTPAPVRPEAAGPAALPALPARRCLLDDRSVGLRRGPQLRPRPPGLREPGSRARATRPRWSAPARPSWRRATSISSRSRPRGWWSTPGSGPGHHLAAAARRPGHRPRQLHRRAAPRGPPRRGRRGLRPVEGAAAAVGGGRHRPERLLAAQRRGVRPHPAARREADHRHPGARPPGSSWSSTWACCRSTPTRRSAFRPS